MIIPLKDANGVPDLSRLFEWTAECDRCRDRCLLADTEPWLVGMHQEQPVYCPTCVQALAARLIDPVFRPSGLPGVIYDARRAPHRIQARLRRTLRPPQWAAGDQSA